LSQDEFGDLAELVSMSSGGEQEYAVSLAKAAVLSYWKDYVEEFVRDADLLNGVYAPEHYRDGRSELRDAVSEGLNETGLKFDWEEVGEICNEINMDSIAERNAERQYDSYEPYQAPPDLGDKEEQLIDDLFDRDIPKSCE
jgi:hypothetical protein